MPEPDVSEKDANPLILALFLFLAFILPATAVILASLIFSVPLPTLTFISLTILLLGSFACWPAKDRKPPGAEGVILLLLGQSMSAAVLILVLIRAISQGWAFRW